MIECERIGGDGDGNITRRQALVVSAAALGAARGLVAAAQAAEETESHGMSVFGDLKYPADFKHFDYVNPGETNKKRTGSWPCRTGDGNRKLNPRVAPNKIAAVRLANLKKLFPMLRGEINSSVSIIPTPSWEKRKKNVEEIIQYRYRPRLRS